MDGVSLSKECCKLTDLLKRRRAFTIPASSCRRLDSCVAVELEREKIEAKDVCLCKPNKMTASLFA
jgi:hypothetical protein